MVGVDGSKPSKLALSWAVPISAATGASIDTVTDGFGPEFAVFDCAEAHVEAIAETAISL